MNTFSLDLCVTSLKMRLVAIGFVHDSHKDNEHTFQHRHNLFELQYIKTGFCTTKIGERHCEQQEGEVFLIAPGVYHSQKKCSSPFEKMCIIFELPAPPVDIGSVPKDIYLSLSTMRWYTCKAAGIDNVLTSIKLALSQMDANLHAAEEIRILTELLLLRLIQRITTTDDMSAPKSSARVQRAYLIDEFFNINFHRNDGDVLLADMLGISIRQLNRILKTLYGLNFRDKLKEIRLEVALDLLASGKSITSISEIMGYSCPANFSTFIKNATGKTPTQLKHMIK